MAAKAVARKQIPRRFAPRDDSGVVILSAAKDLLS